MSIRERLAMGLVRAGIKMSSSSGTPAYSSTGRIADIRGWSPTESAVNLLLAGEGDKLRRQARDLERRNCWARNAADSYVGNVIGTGIVPNPLHPDPAKRKLLQEEWRRWTDQADADDTTDFYGLQAQASRTAFVAGECLARLRPRRLSDGLRVPLQLQMLEPEHLPLTMNEDPGNGNRIRWGIEYSPIARRVAYHLYREHPGELPVFYAPLSTSRVPANEVSHLYHARRPGQQRGETSFAASMLPLYELETYDRAELVRKGLTAMIAFFERDIDGNNPPILGQTETDEQGRPMQTVEPGAYIRLPNGKTIEMSDPKDVGGMYVEFLRVQLRKIAAGLGITYEMLTGDLTGVNYSSIRAGLLEFRRRAESFQHQVIVYKFCRPVWNAFCDAAALAGVIDASDYAANMVLYRDVEWTPPAWAWVDPLKDVQAEVIAVDNLFKARSQVIKESGFDPETTDEMIAADQQREEQLNLTRRSKNGQQVSDTQAQAQDPMNGGNNAAQTAN